MEDKIKILMLEDLPDDVGLIERVLRKENISFTGRQVDTRDEFIAALKEFQPDVVLSDHALPQFNSVEALKLCKKHNSKTAFILVTGAVSEEFAVNCLKEGADDYVLKSNLARLPLAITQTLKQKKLESKKIKAEKELRKQNEELVKINQELDSFVYSISHNLRAPLMSVLGLLNIAKMEDEEINKPTSKYYALMERSILKLDDTLKEILDYSRNSRGEIHVEKINLATLFEESFERMRYMSGSSNIEKQIDLDDTFEFYSDPLRVTIVFNNLISNSIKYRDNGKAQSFIQIKAMTYESGVNIYYSDNGIGIEEEHLHRIFDMFFRATMQSEGAGLGLYILKETIEKIEGKINVSSKVGEGVSFMINLPNLPVTSN